MTEQDLPQLIASLKAEKPYLTDNEVAWEIYARGRAEGREAVLKMLAPQLEGIYSELCEMHVGLRRLDQGVGDVAGAAFAAMQDAQEE